MSLIFTHDSDIRPQDLTLDYYLTATPVGGGKTIPFSGLDSYKIGPFSDSLGFGITSIDIDVKPSLQPVITIVFKDLYGNLIFNKNNKDEFNFDVLFQLPYPKFRLYVKGYLGKPISFLLQVKSVKTTFQPSDGSYELKAEFVPNVFGFFNDIPYQFLFAVKELKKINGDTSNGSDTSIIEIAKIGQEVTTKVQQAVDKYAPLKSQLQTLSSGYAALGSAFKAGTLKLDPIAGDTDLSAKGFTPIKFNIIYKDNAGNLLNKFSDSDLETIGKTIFLSINSTTQLDLSKPIATLTAYIATDTAKKQDVLVKKILDDNNKAALEASQSQAYSSVEDRVIDTQSIYNVMTRLAGDCAYILGYILEAGLAGYNTDAGTANDRDKNENIFGNYYPLIENTNINNTATTLGGQIPWSGAKTEIAKVEEFVKSLYTGKQVAETVIQEATGQNLDLNEGPEFENLQKKISNAETFLGTSSYSNNADSIATSLIQRAGLLSAGFAGPSSVTTQAGGPKNEFLEAEVLNFTNPINKLKGTEKETLKTFCNIVRTNFTSTGDLDLAAGKNFGSATSAGPSLRDYFAAYFNKFPNASKEPAQFYQSKASNLRSVYTYNNGILYHSPKNLYETAKSIAGGTSGPKTNNLINSSDSGGEVLVYAKSLDGEPIPGTDALINTDPTNTSFDPSLGDQKIAVSSSFYQMYSAVTSTSDEPNKCVFVDYAKLRVTYDTKAGSFTSQYFSPQQMFVKHSKSGTNGEKPGPNDVIFRLLSKDSSADYTSSYKPYVINLEDDKLTRAYLYFFCDRILSRTYLNKTEQEIKDLKAQQAKTDSLYGGGSGQADFSEQDTGPRPYERDEAEINAVYTQFHHICQAWIALANTSIEALAGDGGLPSDKNDKTMNLRSKLEAAYRSTDTNNTFFYINFEFPLVSQADPNIDIRDAIINTDPLLENNAQTSTLNMMQNICTMNNFLLQPIPGGVTKDLDEIFLPQPNHSLDGAGRNALSVIWAPTPENRLSKNNDNPIYPDKGWFNQLNNITKPVLALQYGDPNNIIVKSVKAGTDDNKVTSESLQATSDIVNNQNQNKKKSFDCSMLAVMQGRSYKISLDLIGNAQIFPTMLLAVDGLPIFKGLYWITEVVHKLTPNNMETTVDAVKMKYNGDGRFAAVLPITKRSIRSATGTFVGGGGGGTENLGFGGDLNYKFLQLVKDVKIKKTDDINAVIKKFSKPNYPDFTTWFNSELAGNKKPLCAAKVNATNFKSVWDFLIPVVWPDYGTAGCNFLEFLALHCIIYEETGGSYVSKHEGMNSVDNADHPGIAYAFDAYTLAATNGKEARSKSSYNKSPYNKLAGELFNDQNYIDSFKNLKYGNDPKVFKSNDAAWKGTNFPKSSFANVKEAVTTSPTFISEADFYKYAGRGFIGSTWRSSYKEIVKFILTYSGSDAIVRKYQGNWKASPFNGNEETILTKASNADWDELFSSGAIQGYSIYSHAKSSKYQYIAPLDKPKEELIKGIEKEAKKVNGGNDYVRVHRTRVYTILDTLYPDGVNLIQLDDKPINYIAPAPAGSRNADNTCTSVQQGKNTIWVHTGLEKQFRKREVRSITLHYTAGYGMPGKAQGTVYGVGACPGDPDFGGQGGIHYAVDWGGQVARGIPEDIYSIHGNSWNEHGIGIEVNNLGKMQPRPDKGNGANGNPIFYSPAGSRFHFEGEDFKKFPMPPIVDLGFTWLGNRYYQEYTTAQITSLEKLIREILTRYPKIKEAIQGQDLWSFTFRAVDGKPAPGSEPRVPKYPKGSNGKYGIFTHWASTGGDHTDSAPTPKLVAMLKRLGMTG